MNWSQNLILLLPLFATTLASGIQNQTVANHTICETTACYDIAEQLEKDMNITKDPCEDFYGHVCGSWMAKFKQDGTFKRRFEAPAAVINRRMQEILESDYKSNYPPILLEALTYYNQCKAVNSKLATNRKAIVDYVKSEKLSHLGGWPMITPNWNESDFNLEKTLIYLHQDVWVNAIFGTDALYADETGKKGKMELEVENPLAQFGRLATTTEFKGLLFRNALLERAILSDVRKVFVIFSGGVPSSVTKASKDIRQLKTFVLELAEIAATYKTDLTETKTLAEITAISDNVNWTNYYKSVFGINDTHKIYTNFTGIQKVNELLKQTSKRTVANYVIWKYLSAYINRVSECVSGTKEAFAHAMGALYVQRYLDDNMFNEIKEYLNEVRSLFNQLLDSATWMDKETRDRAKRKLELIKTNVGYPDMYKDAERLKRFHNSLNITRGDDVLTYLRNVDATLKFKSTTLKDNWADRKINFLYQDGAVVTNAAYFALENSIAVFVGILIEPFYHPHRPLAMNYGSIGYVIGHEFTHAFDNKGRNYDENGHKVNWWTDYSAQQYQKRYECYLDHYAKVAENKENATDYSKYTAGENIADGGGLHEAYEALKSLLKKRDSAGQRLPGKLSTYTPEQLFFVSFANSYCASFPDSIKDLWMYIDVHSMDNNRVIGNIMNSRGFSEAFKCPAGSKMNPSKKCSLFE